MSIGASETRLLDVKPVSLGPDFRTSMFYGAGEIAADYCGLKAPFPPIPGVWMHGWVPSHLRIDPSVVAVAYNPPDPLWRIFVATIDQRDFLRQRGFTDVHAIGLPIVYASASDRRREPGSLLVMPPHSTRDSHFEWDEEGYANAIESVRDRFSRVTVCVHPSCWERGYWVESFRRRGYELVKGIGGAGDGNPLESMRDLLSSFEFVTTNGFGSHIVYAAYFGCKVSIFGPWAPDRADSLQTPAFVGRRRFWREAARRTQYEEVAAQFPFLVCQPDDAVEATAWAREEVGYANRRAPADLRALFGWRASDRVKFAVRKAKTSAIETSRAWTPEGLKLIWRQLPNHPDGATAREEARLRSLPAGTRGVSALLGADVEFADPHAFLRDAKRIFDRQIYRFASESEAPFVIDCGAGIGLSVLHVKALHPTARIIAFEPDPQVCDVLTANIRRFGLQNVDVRQEAVTGHTGLARFRLHSGGGSRLAKNGREPNTIDVKAARLRDLLTEKVDLIKLDIEGAEIDVLQDCEGALAHTDRVFVEYHSYIEQTQSLAEALRILGSAGLRVYLETTNPSANPFLTRNIQSTGIDSLDMVTDIWAYRC